MKKLLIYIGMATVLALTGCAADNGFPAETAVPSPPTQTTLAASETMLVSPETATAETQAVAAFVRLISPEDARDLIGQPGVTLLDVREQHEYDAAHIEGAVLLPYDTITADSFGLPENKDEIIIVYCRSGRRSAIAAETLAQLGYTNIYDLGGIQDWPYDTVS